MHDHDSSVDRSFFFKPALTLRLPPIARVMPGPVSVAALPVSFPCIESFHLSHCAEERRRYSSFLTGMFVTRSLLFRVVAFST